MNAIIKFLKTGELGDLKIGQTKHSAQKYLGVHEAVSYNKSSIVIKYGCIQLSFYKKIEFNLEEYILKHIHIDFDNAVDFPAILDLNGWCPKTNMSYIQFLEETKKYGVNLYEDKEHTFKNIQVGFKSDSGVIIIFDDEDGKNGIVSMSLFKVY